MSTLDPTVVQQLPTAPADAVDVGNAVVVYLTDRNFTEVAKDHESRIAFGEKKYGQRLKIHNGRNAIMDSYQELLDALSYLMQGHLEGIPGCLTIFNHTADLAAVVRGML